MSAEEALVKTYNDLPRSPLAPSGEVVNNWHFAIRHVPLNPPGDLLFIMNTAAEFVCNCGPFQLSTLPLEEKAALVALELIKTFNNNMNQDPVVGQQPKPTAPWKLSTNDPELGAAVEATFKKLGVKPEMCSVTPGTAQENKITEESWNSLLQTIKQTMGV